MINDLPADDALAPPTRGEAPRSDDFYGNSGKPLVTQTVPELLEGAAATYRERNAIYGDNYKRFGPIMAEMFPDGLTLKTADDFNRIGVFVQAMAKFTRYAANFGRGGHRDSAHDTQVYMAMQEELDLEINARTQP